MTIGEGKPMEGAAAPGRTSTGGLKGRAGNGQALAQGSRWPAAEVGMGMEEELVRIEECIERMMNADVNEIGLWQVRLTNR
jgi:hypothetical protein